jgi:hypothetical protein
MGEHVFALEELHMKCFEDTDSKFLWKSGMVVHTCNPSTQEAEAGGSGVGVQPGLHRETLSQTNNKNIYVSTMC